MPTFRTLCETIQKISETRGSNAKIRICADYFSTIESEQDLNLAAQFIAEGAFSNRSGKRASVGSRTAGLATASFCEIDYDLVFKPCRTATGSNSETIERLMANIPAAQKKREPIELTLSDVQEDFERLRKASSRADKESVLFRMWRRMTPIEIKYSIRMLSQGSLRIGFESRSVIAAIAKAFGQDRENVRYAHMICGSMGKTAVLAKKNQLDKATFKLFHPLSFMLASPIGNKPDQNIQDYVVEEKFDGMRAQVHVNRDQVKIFSRDLNDITHSFPDLESFFMERELPPLVLDGEICVYKNEVILPFQMLQKRMGLKKPTKKILQENPALFVTFDLLFVGDTALFDNTLLERREMLKNITSQHKIPVTAQKELSHFDEIDSLFQRALHHGNEGLMLKNKHSTYEYGQRGKSWLKVKKPGGSFDTVIMYAHAGSGKRGGMYSDFTLGISVKDDERYEEEFIPIGKAYGGYSNDELKLLNEKIKELTVEKYGPTIGLMPGIVVEIEFDDIQINKRTKAGYTLRFPRFKAIRWDLESDSVDTLEQVEAFYKAKLEMERLKQTQNPSFEY